MDKAELDSGGLQGLALGREGLQSGTAERRVGVVNI
jgi:hypothetical protein